jgi:nucleotide-binding universal stress UspA family protein
MTSAPTVYLPVDTFPEVIADAALQAAVRFAALLGGRLRVTAFAVDLPQAYTPLAGMAMDVGGLVRAVEARSAAEAGRAEQVISAAAAPGQTVEVVRRVVPAGVGTAASVEARYADVTVLPWAEGAAQARDIAETVVFGAGRPVVVVPAGWEGARLDHLAVGWDGSRVAARALADALRLMPMGARVTVLTVRGEKPVEGYAGPAIAGELSRAGWQAVAMEVPLDGRSVAGALQDRAHEAGAQLLAMGGFGHSRMRDLILGGATQGVLTDLRMPVLLSH